MTLLIQLHPPNTYTRSRTNSNTMTLVFVDLPLLPFPTLSAHLRYPHIQILFEMLSILSYDDPDATESLVLPARSGARKCSLRSARLTATSQWEILLMRQVWSQVEQHNEPDAQSPTEHIHRSRLPL